MINQDVVLSSLAMVILPSLSYEYQTVQRGTRVKGGGQGGWEAVGKWLERKYRLSSCDARY